MAIRFSNYSVDFELKGAPLVAKWITEVVVLRGKRIGNISYLFCGDEYMLDVNRKFLSHDTYTDIITFDYVVGDSISGDILISVERIAENAKLHNVPEEQELHRVIIHGVLHLLGQGDKTVAEATEMRRQEEEALRLYDQLFHEKHQC